MIKIKIKIGRGRSGITIRVSKYWEKPVFMWKGNKRETFTNKILLGNWLDSTQNSTMSKKVLVSKGSASISWNEATTSCDKS